MKTYKIVYHTGDIYIDSLSATNTFSPFEILNPNFKAQAYYLKI